MSRRPRSQTTTELLAEARALSGDFDRLSQAVADRVGLSPTEVLAMDLISRSGSLSAGELGRELRLTSGAITGLVDRLEKAGYAKRLADPDDRRRVLVTATARERKIGELYAPLAAALRSVIAGYSERDLVTLTEFIRRFRSAVGETAAKLPRA
jgi:DNA-binding MarR family transcriptional regulator